MVITAKSCTVVNVIVALAVMPMLIFKNVVAFFFLFVVFLPTVALWALFPLPFLKKN